ncbi:SAV_6107 family HEPN domain-containing protein [Streptomyces sp. NPDC058045]|uniref:SAV_6107 family HEPN domain-containing protein n=1 Tax=Streptomyces sp. NPDC058045 TaxID=3346311 RepID=UPI0036E029F6
MKKSPRQGAAPPPAAADLLASARRGLETAHDLDGPLQQYAAIHLAALRAAAAVLDVKRRPEHRLGRRARIRSTWDLLPEVAPEFAEFAAYFDKTTIKRIRAEAGIIGAVDIHELEDVRHMTTLFMRKVEALDDVKNATTAQKGSGDGAATMRRTS